MTNFRLIRCFCYGIILSSVLWGILIYVFLNEVGHDSLSGPGGFPYGQYVVKNRPVRIIAKQHPGVKPHMSKPVDGDHWKDNLVISQGMGNDLNNDINLKLIKPKKVLPRQDDKDVRWKEGRGKGKEVNMDLKEDGIGIVRNDSERSMRDNGYRQHAFNELISIRIGFHRNVTDTRNPLCKYQVYSDELPKTSIIICFYNEAWSTLLRTVYSVLDRTPQKLLHEIILVDDFSEHSHLHTELDDYINQNLHGLVTVIHNSKREGLIRARTIGARQATGEVLMFLDSHCEVNEMWLEPLLERIHANPHTVVCPIIDIVSADSFEYTASPLVKGGFNWGMHFKWDAIKSSQLVGKEDYIKPIESPTMAGGLFAMDREYFHHLGEYDEGLDIWGGENLEISFRIWQCGGILEIIPCSRVGHVFRRRRPYGSPGHQDTTTRNAVRVAQVWMDEYKEHYFNVQPKARNIDYGDISSRVALRKRLQCKSFKWFLEMVYPELRTPDQTGGGAAGPVDAVPRNAPARSIRKGKLKHPATGLCLMSMSEITTKGTELKLGDCDVKKLKDIMWYQSSANELKLGDVLCLDMAESSSASLPRLHKCDGMGGSQRWMFKDQKIYHPVSGQCLSVKQSGGVFVATLAICGNDSGQDWRYMYRR